MGGSRSATFGNSGNVLVSDLMSDGLSHHGIKGMKWGVHRDGSGPVATQTHHPSADAIEARVSTTKAASAGSASVLSNQELQKVITRMSLESQYNNLTASQHKSELDKGLASTQKILKVGKTVEDIRKFMGTPTGKAVKTGLSVAFTAATAYATGGGSAAAKVGASLVIRKAANHYTNVG